MVDGVRRRINPAQARQRAETTTTTLRTARRVNLEQEVSGSRSTTSSGHTWRTTVHEHTQDEILPATRFGPGEEPAFVRIGVGKTINIGKYESLRIDVAVTLPCLPEQVEATYERARDLVTEKLAQEETYLLGTSQTNLRTARRR